MSPKTREIVSRVHGHTEVALWAILFAFVLYFIAFVMLNVSETQAQREIIRVQEIAAENEAFCEKLDIKRGTNKYNQCLLDIGQFRLKAEKRVLDFVY
jgi:hypothetical protein